MSVPVGAFFSKSRAITASSVSSPAMTEKSRSGRKFDGNISRPWASRTNGFMTGSVPPPARGCQPRSACGRGHREVDDPRAVDVDDPRLAEALDERARVRVRVAVQQQPRAGLEHPLAQRDEADVGRVVRVVVDAVGRAVADDDVGRRQLADQPRRPALAVGGGGLAVVAAVLDAALEPAHGQAGVELDPPHVEVLDPELLHVRLVVVVAAHAELRHVHEVERLQPARLQVAEAQDRLQVVLGGQRAGVRVERAVGEGERAHRLHPARLACAPPAAGVVPSARERCAVCSDSTADASASAAASGSSRRRKASRSRAAASPTATASGRSARTGRRTSTAASSPPSRTRRSPSRRARSARARTSSTCATRRRAQSPCATATRSCRRAGCSPTTASSRTCRRSRPIWARTARSSRATPTPSASSPSSPARPPAPAAPARETRRAGGDVRAGIRAAVAWIAEHLPLYALNFVLTTPDELWALRYPDTNELWILERRAGGPR